MINLYFNRGYFIELICDVNYYFCYQIIKDNKNTYGILVVIFSNTFFSKSILGFQFWTFINVHFGKSEKSLEKYSSK